MQSFGTESALGPAVLAPVGPDSSSDQPPQRPADQKQRRWILNAFDMSTAGHQSPGLWKVEGDRSAGEGGYHDIEYWTDVAKTLEKGKFNGLFVADTLGAYDVYGGSIDGGAQWGVDDPMLMVSAAAAVTKNLAFGITHSVTYDPPYVLARRFSTLDHLTKGRVAFNVVTSYLDSAARNFGLSQQIQHDERYRRAEEYMNVLYKLWESSWRDDAVVLDKTRDVYAEPERIRKIHHHGEFFDVEGPSFVEPSIQRTPLIYQAGSSSAGLKFGARHAEAVFMSGPSVKKIRQQVDALRLAVRNEGRDPYAVKVLVKLTVIVDETEEKAVAKRDHYQALASREGAKVLFGGWIGENLALYSPSQDLREHGTPAVAGVARGYASLYPSIKLWNADTLADHFKLGGMGPVVVGTASQVADKLQNWIDDADIDGFMTPGTFEDIVEHLVPELQRRGVHWLDYPEPSNGRKHLTAREGIYGTGQTRLAEDHYGSAFKWNVGDEVGPRLETGGGVVSERNGDSTENPAKNGHHGSKRSAHANGEDSSSSKKIKVVA